MVKARSPRRLPIGAEVLSGDGVHFRVWAPKRKKVTVILESGPGSGSEIVLQAEKQGYFSAAARNATAGTLYRFRLDRDPHPYPDPASRFQPDGPHGPSQVIDPAAFRWSDKSWNGTGLRGQVLYELHIGTFTPEGTWEAAARRLPDLAGLDITAIEVMPVADFAGTFGWGYDGVDLFAPTRLYGTPDDFRRFVDRAHAAGLGVILDVVYNHIGPDGNYLGQFAPYLTDRKHEWGEALDFSSEPVREFFIANAGYWIDEYHIDGLRLDAVDCIHDSSDEHILTAIGKRVRAAAGKRQTLIVAENARQEAVQVRPLDRDGFGLDAIWNDDFHHSALVAATGRTEAHYRDFGGTPQQLISAVKHGFLFQGQRFLTWGKPRGTPALDLDPVHFVTFLENHDQVANTARGLRLHQLTSPGRLRALTALWLLAPQTPMLFMGQEFASSRPFLFFADHHPDLAKLVRQGRCDFLKQFPSVADPAMVEKLDAPDDPLTFQCCKLDWNERQVNATILDLHRDLLELRRRDSVFASQRRGLVDGAVLANEAFALRFFGAKGDDRLLLVNLGRDLHYSPAPEPLLATPDEKAWHMLWSSEAPRYGGGGTPRPQTDDGWRLPGHAALVMSATGGD
jgi:maltooligosyltrehalose trehalohydrolase